MMRRFKNFALIVLVGAAFSACSHMEAGSAPETAAPQSVDITNKNITNGQNTNNAVAPVQVQASSTVTPMPDYRDVTRYATNGSVEIFPLDGSPATSPAPYKTSNGAVEIGGAAPRALIPAGKGVAVNRSVEIFPLGDQMGTPWASNAPQKNNAYESFTGIADGSALTIYYAHGSSSLNAADRETIASVAREAKSRAKPVRVEGHASVQSEINDPVLRKIANLKISMDRAFKVTEALIKEGVPGEQIETKAYGEERPPTNIPGGKNKDSASRRVEIYGLPENR